MNDHIRQAVFALTPTHAEEIWSIPVEKADSDAWFLEGTEVKQIFLVEIFLAEFDHFSY